MPTDSEIRGGLADQLLAACAEVQPAAASIILDVATERVKRGQCVAFKKHSQKVVIMLTSQPPARSVSA